MLKLALKIAYLGGDFYGFQRQPGLPTVEGELLRTLQELNIISNATEARYSIAGRTDRGVHALGNVISFLTDERIIINQVNDELPSLIQILGQASVHYGFKPRYARERHYRYHYPLNPIDSEINIIKIREVCPIFLGTHDFSNFSRRSERNPVRTINSLEVIARDDTLKIDVKGESFLWNMVRKMVAVLVEVGQGKLEPSDIKNLLNPENKAFIKPAPPQGLILMDVSYDGVKFNYDKYACNVFYKKLQESYLKSLSQAVTYSSMAESLKNQYSGDSNLKKDP